MNEEKDLDQLESDTSGSDGGFGGLEDFVELDDLQNLEGLGDLSGLGDISDLGDLSDLPGAGDETVMADDLDFEGSVPVPGMEEAEGEELVKEAGIAGETAPDIPEEVQEDKDVVLDEEVIDTLDLEAPAEQDLPEEIPEEPGVTDAIPESGTEEELQEDKEEPDGLDLDDLINLDTYAEAEDNAADAASGDGEEDTLQDDISLDAIGDSLPEEEAIMEEEPVQEEAAPVSVPEEAGSADDAGEIDNMLDGLLDTLDINGSLDAEEPLEDTASMEEPDDGDGLDNMLDSLGMPEAVAPVAVEETEKEELQEEAPVEKKPGFFKRVFGNVVTDEIAEAERKAKEEEEEQAVLKAEEEAKAKEEKAAKKAAAAEAKEAKKAEKAAKKAEKAEEKAAKKAEKAAKKEAEKEAEEQEVVGKLNKAGVIIVVAGAAVILAGVIFGTNIFGYNSAKSEAERYFTLQRYSDAYEAARGSGLQDKEPEMYDKIVTVMKVQQSLDTYSSYAEMKYYPDALNALLRGLQKYDENIDMAMDLEIENDMKVCKNRILSILKEEFALSEQEASQILSLDAEAYTEKVVGIAKKKI